MQHCETILIVGNFNSGALENFYVTGFRKCGVIVHTYEVVNQFYTALNKNMINRVVHKLLPDTFYHHINRELLHFLEKNHFDAILVFKGMELFPETVAQMKACSKLVCNYNADHPFVFYMPGSGNKNVVNSIPFYDIHFSYAGSIVEQLKQKYSKEAFCIPFGYDADKAIPASIDTSEFTGSFLFIAAYDRERSRYMDHLRAHNVGIYGNSKWKERNFLHSGVRDLYRGRPLYGEEYIAAIAFSEGIINLLRKQNILEQSHNMRTFEVPGYGGLLISQRTREQLDYFEEDKEAIYFDTAEELKDKLSFLKRNPHAGQKIKEAARSRAI